MEKVLLSGGQMAMAGDEDDISKNVGNYSQEWPEVSLFNNYYTKV